MLTIQGRTDRYPNGATRRSFLKVGALGIAGLTLPQLLALRQAQSAEKRRDTAVILFWLAGGPSHIDTYDLKPDATPEVRGPFQPIETRVPGLSLCELLPKHAAIADKLAIVRSLHHNLAVHDDGSHWVQTGYPLFDARARGQQHPAQGAVVSAIKGPNKPGLPAYICIPEDYRRHMGFYQSAVYLGARHNAVNSGDPSRPGYEPPELSLPANVTLPRLEARRALQAQFDGLSRRIDTDPAFRALDEINAKALELTTGPRARDAFDLSREPEALKERYGRHTWGQSALLARRLVEAGVTFVTINFYEKDVDWWDDHTTIEKNLRRRLPPFDQSLATLVEDLHERGLGKEVLVVACGEFGRGPRIDTGAGRGHWPKAMSALLAGGGIRGGQVIGSTTSDGGEPHDRPLVPGDLLASIYRVLGIDHESALPDRQGRPIPLLPAGVPVRELFT